MVKRGRIDGSRRKRGRMALIEGTLDYQALSQADVVIEAVLQNMDLKRRIFAALDKAAKPGAVLASNTSTLDVAQVAQSHLAPAGM